MVEGVEILPTKLQRLAFDNQKLFREGKIEHSEARTTQRALGGVAIAEWGLRQRVGRRVEPESGVWMRNMRIADDVGPEVVEVGVDRRCIGKHRRERETRIDGRNAAQTPSACQRIDGFAGVCEIPPAFAERKVPVMNQRERMLAIERRGTVIPANVVIVGKVVTTFAVG